MAVSHSSHSPYLKNINSQALGDLLELIHDISLRLVAAPTMSEFYRQVVVFGRIELGLDRLTVLLYHPETQTMSGTWGVDNEGNITDDSSYSGSLDENLDKDFIKQSLSEKNIFAIWEDHELSQRNQVVGTGWNAMVTLWDGDRPLGWLAADNLISKMELNDKVKAVLAFYGRTIANLMISKNREHELAVRVEEQRNLIQSRFDDLLKNEIAYLENEKLVGLGRLVAGVAHEINTPLGNAITMISYVGTKVKETLAKFEAEDLTKSQLETMLGETIEYTGRIEGSLHRAADLVQSFKRLSADQSATDEVQRVNLSETIKSVVKSFTYMFKKSNVLLYSSIPSPLFIRTFPGGVGQVLGNLLINTLRHAFACNIDHRGRVQLRVIPIFHGDGESERLEGVQLEVEDNGCGMDAETKRRVFDPFFTTRRDQGGSGLGLSIVHNLVTTKLRGSIHLESSPGEGSHFVLRIPHID